MATTEKKDIDMDNLRYAAESLVRQIKINDLDLIQIAMADLLEAWQEVQFQTSEDEN